MLERLKPVFIPFFYFLVIFACYPGLFLDFSTAVPRGDAGDLQNILGIVSFSIHSPLAQVYHLPILYPAAFMLAKTHPLFGISLLFFLFKGLGLTLVQGTNLYIILSLGAGAWGTYLLAREFVQKPFFPLLLSTLYILHPLNHLHFVWLNFLGRFYIPFIILFLLRYLKSGKRGYAAAAVVFSFLQFLTSVYYGTLLWAVIIPVFLLIASILKLTDFARLRFLLICLGVGLLLIVLIFSPYITHNTSAEKHYDGRLTQVEELFSVSKVFAAFFGTPANISQYLFPGIFFAFMGLLFFSVHLPRRRYLTAGILFFSLLAMCYLVYTGRDLLNVVFLVFLLFLAYLLFVSWKEIEPWTKLLLLLLAFMFFFLFHFTYPSFMKSLSPYLLFHFLLPVGGLTVIKRTFLMLLPLFVVLAAVGASRFFERIPGFAALKPWKKYILFVLLLAVLALENIRSPLLYLNTEDGVMKSLPQTAEVYRSLPFRSGKVVLEIPFYLRRRLKNSQYPLNWQFHQNPLLNGEVSIEPKGYYQKLTAAIGKFQEEFPSEEGLKRLLHDYSVSYIVIHWDMLADYQRFRRSPVPREIVRGRIANLKQYLEIIDDAPGHIVLRLQENFPLKEIIRTYSYYHLKSCKVKITLKEVYRGVVRIFQDGQPFKTVEINGTSVELDFKDAPLSDTYNTVRFQFDREINLSTIDLI